MIVLELARSSASLLKLDNISSSSSSSSIKISSTFSFVKLEGGFVNFSFVKLEGGFVVDSDVELSVTFKLDDSVVTLTIGSVTVSSVLLDFDVICSSAMFKLDDSVA